MKKVFILGTLLLVLSFTGCSSGISQEEYDALKTELETSNGVIKEKDAEIYDLEKKISDLEKDFSDLQNEFDSYKEVMSEYEGLATSEAEARKIEAEAKIQAEKEAAEAAEAKAAAEAEAKEKAGYDTGITYSQLARTPDDYIEELVKFTGTVLQVIEGDEEIQIRLAVNDDYDKVLYCGYSPDIVNSRVLEDDKITIYGQSVGLYSYESTLGGQITIPAVWIDKIDQ